jgi:hypothetical protein
MKLICLIAFALSSTLAFAGHPAADRVVDVFESVSQLLNKPDSTVKRGLCDLFERNLEKSSIATGLLGKYASSSDTRGVKAFRQELVSFMVSKTLPEFSKLNGGSYSVSNNVSNRSGGGFAVSVTVRTGAGKSYSGKVILNSNLLLKDVEYWGFSGVNYAGQKMREKIDKFARQSSTPVTAFVNDMRKDKNYVSCR